ncbi:MAG TPA: class I SAM-dependent methyltransferase [Micromonosporaceae bacterium]
MTPYVLFPGRHHLLTRYQAEYLHTIAGEQTTVIFAVTSANHTNTRRNPVPYDRREAAIERFSVLEDLRCLVVPVFDTKVTDRFAEVILKNVLATTGLQLTPADTVVACSTPELTTMYQELGFRVAGVEADAEPAPARPWDLLLDLAAGGGRWQRLAHPATLDVYERYRLAEHIRAVINDPVVGDEGGLTPTRDYRTYVESFAFSAARKWVYAREYVRPGRIVDIGCGAGAVLELIDNESALRECDLIGVEVARHLYEECVHKKSQGIFRNPNVYFYHRNVLGGAVFPPRSIDTTLTFAITHEIWSYGSRWQSLAEFAKAIFEHTVPGGVWINSDVCGPDGGDRRVILALRDDDGDNPAQPRRDLHRLSRMEVEQYVQRLSTRARFDQFVVDFRYPCPHLAHPDGTVELRLADAMDFLTRKDYTDSWLAETQEQFCGLSFADWKKLLTDVGFEVDGASRAWRNDWLVEHRLAPVASISTVEGRIIDWPVTHVLLVARRPWNS